MTGHPDLKIVPLTPDRLADLVTLFEQGGDPKWCWCAYYRVRSTDFSKASKTRHRSIMEASVADVAVEGRAPGLVAYEDDEAVGWISIGPREDYERLAHSRVLGPIDETPVWSIVCFVVGRRSRGRGIARALLAAGVAYAREHGAKTLEAYPVEVPDATRVPSANVYRGTLSMFEAAGFTVVARRAVPGGATRPIVRLGPTLTS
jgi:GNAT superfamily N-acetyltransferase